MASNETEIGDVLVLLGGHHFAKERVMGYTHVVQNGASRAICRARIRRKLDVEGAATPRVRDTWEVCPDCLADLGFASVAEGESAIVGDMTLIRQTVTPQPYDFLDDLDYAWGVRAVCHACDRELPSMAGRSQRTEEIGRAALQRVASWHNDAHLRLAGTRSSAGASLEISGRLPN